MKKSEGVGLLVLVLAGVFLLLISANASAQNSADNEKILKAFQCLDSEVAANSQLSLQQAIFAGLAGVPNSKIDNKTNDEKSASAECWPKSSCNVKETAQVLIMKEKRQQEHENITLWLKAQTGAPTGLVWYLQLTTGDGTQTGTCNVNGATVNIGTDGKLSGLNAGESCFTISQNEYWLQIKDSCLDQTFGVSCSGNFSGDFKANLLYQKQNGATVYVSSNTESANSGEFKQLSIRAKCFRQGGVCNYEATLWGTFALYKANDADYQSFIPYLLALAPDNQGYFPEAFLAGFIGGNRNSEQREAVKAKRISSGSGGYWGATTQYNKYQSTSLAMMGLGGASSVDVVNGGTINYLFGSSGGRTEKGCWNNNNIADTAFILYASGWAHPESSSNFVCNSDSDCLSGESCQSGQCVAGSGIACTSNADCLTDEICQNGACIAAEEILPDLGGQNLTCAEVGGACRTTCNTNETIVNASCSIGGESCCFPSGSGGTYNPTPITDCELGGFYCVPDYAACVLADGAVQTSLFCSGPFEECCTIDVQPLPTCAQLGGVQCEFDQACSELTVQSEDGACCRANCIDDTGTAPTAECSTDSDCLSDEVCESGQCVAGGESKSSRWWIILILSILILIVILLIIYRNKIKIWWFRRKGKVQTSRVEPGQGGMPLTRRLPPRFGPPTGMQQRPAQAMRPASGMRPQQGTPQRRAVSQKDKEIEDTLEKLRKMSE